MATTPVNTLSIETPQGYREFQLVQGDISAQPADLLICSANAGPGRPMGGVLSALEDRYGSLDLDRAGLVLSLTGHSPFRLSTWPGPLDSLAGVYALSAAAGSPFQRLLMLRLPGAGRFDSDAERVNAYRRAVRAAFAAVAALEFVGERYRTIALPVLGGARDFPRLEAITALLETALDWLRLSRHTECIRFAVLDGAETSDWSAAMDQALGRTFADGDYSAAALELRGRLREQIEALLLAEGDSALGGVLRQFRDALTRADTDVSIQQFGALGRLTAEAMAARLCRDLGLAPAANAFGNIERLQAHGGIAKWINSYLHCLRVLGNESVHLTEHDQRIPVTLAAGDLIVILGNMARVLDFYRLWRARQCSGGAGE